MSFIMTFLKDMCMAVISNFVLTLFKKTVRMHLKNASSLSFCCIVEYYSSVSINSSITWQADFATDVPGPKIAITPAL